MDKLDHRQRIHSGPYHHRAVTNYRMASHTFDQNLRTACDQHAQLALAARKSWPVRMQSHYLNGWTDTAGAEMTKHF